MAEAYAGSIVLEVDGTEIEVVKVDPKENTGRKLVKTMNSSGTARGFAQGVAEYTLAISAVVPIDGTEIDWAAIKDAKLTIYPLNQEDKRVSYLGCFTTEVGQSYTVDNEATQDIQMSALRKVVE
ncbi:phage tail protein [Pasteurellaceae bacterium 15-036681]|nr:phage tail protein [Pasteurellaceae bacterium 15-036681]